MPTAKYMLVVTTIKTLEFDASLVTLRRPHVDLP
jgi:hypothetical protein